MNEIDLHGLDSISAIDAFVDYYNDRIRNGDFGNINVIHGYGAGGGEGKIRRKLRSFLSAHPDCLSFKNGEDLDFHNLGETVVFPRMLLPPAVDRLGEKILEYCSVPKVKSKILGKFRIHGQEKVLESMKYLERRNLLIAVMKGKNRVFTAKDMNQRG